LAHRCVAVLAQILAGRAELDRSDTLYREWRRALDVVYGDLDKTDSRLAVVVQEAYSVPVSRSVGELLFVLHTYFALVARLIAVELLATSANDSEGRPTAWRGLQERALVDRLQRLDSGDLPGGLVIGNLFESDLFSWWTALAEGNADLLGVIRELLASVGFSGFPEGGIRPRSGRGRAQGPLSVLGPTGAASGSRRVSHADMASPSLLGTPGRGGCRPDAFWTRLAAQAPSCCRSWLSDFAAFKVAGLRPPRRRSKRCSIRCAVSTSIQ